MLEQFIQNRITQHLPFEANEGQKELLEKLSQFITSPTPRKAFILRGYAGTGKTSIMAALVQAMKELQQQLVLLAPTGRAAKVLSKYAHTPAYTIHKYIYRSPLRPAGTSPSLGEEGREMFTLRDNLHKNTLFVVDEASMISGNGYRGADKGVKFGSENLLDDLVRFVYSGEGCSLLLLGDDAQLPPVGSSQSPALSEDYMAGYQLAIHSHTLTEVARQATDSGILANATRLRPLALGSPLQLPHEGEGQAPSGSPLRPAGTSPSLGEEGMWDVLEFGKDVQTVSGVELLEALEQSYSEVGAEETILLTRTNRRTNIYNQGIRTRILWRDEEIGSGDRLMVSKNNYFWTEKYEDLPFLANGDMLEVVRLRNEREMYGYHFADVQLRSLDYDWEIDAVLWLETLRSDSPEANNVLHKDLFWKIAEDYPELQHSRKKLTEAVYSSPYYHALQVRMAYAITGHKSQGGQWERVFIDPSIGKPTTAPSQRGRDTEAQDFYRWLYTAITRAKEKVYLIKN